MKNYFLGLFLLVGLFSSSVFAEGCFHDPIDVVDEPGTITQGVNFRNLACMLGSEVITTLKAGTKVKIIGKTAWTKVILADGRIGRVGNNFVTPSSETIGFPAFPANHVVDSYCDTTNPSRCPYPAGLGETPTFYTQSVVNPTPAPQTSSSSLIPTPVLEAMVAKVSASLYSKYSDETQRQQKVRNIILALNTLKISYTKLSSAIDYLVAGLTANFL